MTGINKLCEFLMVSMIISCAAGWIVIGIGILKCWKDGKCPKSRICKNIGCQWGHGAENILDITIKQNI